MFGTVALSGDDERAGRKFRGRRHDHAIAGIEARDHFDPLAVSPGCRDGPPVDAIVDDDEYVRLFAVGLDGCLGRQRHRPRGGRRVLILTQERHFDAHVGQNAWIEIQECDPDQHRGLLTVGRRDHRDDARRYLPIRIRVQHGGGLA